MNVVMSKYKYKQVGPQSQPTPDEVQLRYESFPEYKEGYDDYQENGNKNMKCPNSPYNDSRKTAWLVGWLDARTESIFGTIIVRL